VGIILRQGFKSTIASYSGVLLGALNIMVLFPKYFDDTEFGVTRVLLAVSTLIAQFAEFGGSNVINRFFPFFRDEREVMKRFIFWVFALALAFYALIAAGIYFFRTPILEHYQMRGSTLMVDFFGYLFPLVCFILIFNLVESYARSLMRVAVPAFLREVYIRLFQLGGIVLFIFKLIDFEQFMILFAASYATAMLAIIGYVFSINRNFITASLSFGKHVMMKEILVYGIFSILTAGVWRAIVQLDILMLSFMDDSYADALTGVAVYSIASYIVTLIQLPQRSLTQISVPIISHSIKTEDWSHVERLYKKVGLNQFVIGVFLFLGIWVNLENLYSFLPAEYHKMDMVIIFLTAGRLFDMATSFNGELIMYSKFYRFNLWSGLLLIITGVATNIVFIPIYGISGAALATAVTIVFINILRTSFIFLKMGFLPFSKKMLAAIAIGIVVLAVHVVIPQLGSVYLNFLVRSALVVLLYVPLLFFLNVSEDINNAILRITGRISLWLALKAK